jgi:hypothetical protein
MRRQIKDDVRKNMVMQSFLNTFKIGTNLLFYLLIAQMGVYFDPTQDLMCAQHALKGK